MQSVHAEGPERLLGALVDVAIDLGGANSLSGRIVTVDADRPSPSSLPPPAERVSA
jgi:tRNA-2-methylthio-N6-dimethylallyladenosine synthase